MGRFNKYSGSVVGPRSEEKKYLRVAVFSFSQRRISLQAWSHSATIPSLACMASRRNQPWILW